MAAGVQDDDAAGRQAGEAGAHAGKVDAARRRVVVGIAVDDKTGAFKERAVVFPARVADVNLGLRQQALQVIGTELQRTGTAQRLRADHTSFGEQGRILAEQQLLYRLVVGDRPLDGLIAARGHGFEPGFFGAFDRFQQRDFAVLVKIHADAKVNLAGTTIRSKAFVKTKDRIARGHLDRRENGCAHGQVTLFRGVRDRPHQLSGKKYRKGKDSAFRVKFYHDNFTDPAGKTGFHQLSGQPLPSLPTLPARR